MFSSRRRLAIETRDATEAIARALGDKSGGNVKRRKWQAIDARVAATVQRTPAQPPPSRRLVRRPNRPPSGTLVDRHRLDNHHPPHAIDHHPP